MFTDDDLDFYDDDDISDLIVDPDKPWETPGYEWEYSFDDVPEVSEEKRKAFHQKMAKRFPDFYNRLSDGDERKRLAFS